MKNYSLKINGQNYNVQIDNVNENSTLAHVTVNGTPYEVEIAGTERVAANKPQVAPAPKEADSAKSLPQRQHRPPALQQLLQHRAVLSNARFRVRF